MPQSIDNAATALRFRSLVISCDVDECFSSSCGIPSKVKPNHAGLEAIQADFSLGKFVKTVSFDLTYAFHVLDLYQRAELRNASDNTLTFLLKAAWADLHRLKNITDFSLLVFNLENNIADTDLIGDMLDFSRWFKFWPNLRRLTIDNSIFCDQDQENWSGAGDITSSGDALDEALQLSLGLAINIQYLCLGSCDWARVADMLPDGTNLPHLRELDLNFEESVELVCRNGSLAAFRWISKFEAQITKLTIRSWIRYGSDQDDLHLFNDSQPAVLSALTELTLDPLHRPDLISHILPIFAPNLEKLRIHYADRHDVQPCDTIRTLSSLRELTLFCEYEYLQPLWRPFAVMAPQLSCVRYTLSDGGTYWDDVVHTTRLDRAEDGSLKLAELRLSCQADFSPILLKRLLDAFERPLCLHVTWTPKKTKHYSQHKCESCCRFLPTFCLTGSGEAGMTQIARRTCEGYAGQMVDGRRELDQSPLDCRVVIGNGGLPDPECDRCQALEDVGLFPAVRVLCAVK